MAILLTLVHGTWPDPQGWVSARSFLRRELESRLGEVVFREFSWAGTNTHAARTEAGANLAQFIRDVRVEYPHAQHFVIAHSHGGNVSLYAMRDPAVRETVRGVVTVATPFLSARRRDLRHAGIVAWMLLGWAALALLAVIDASGVRFGFPVWLLGSALVMVKTSPWLKEWLVTTASRMQAVIVPAYQPPTIDPSRLFVVSPRGDEAGLWLRIWEIVAKGPFIVGCALLVIADFAFRSNLAAILDGLAERIFHRGLDDIRLFGLDGWTLAIAGLAVCVIWALGLLVISSVMRWPGYWREPVLANLLVRIGSHTVPAGGDHTAHTFEIPRKSFLRRIVNDDLRHSVICEQPVVASAISEWILDRSRTSER